MLYLIDTYVILNKSFSMLIFACDMLVYINIVTENV